MLSICPPARMDGEKSAAYGYVSCRGPGISLLLSSPTSIVLQRLLPLNPKTIHILLLLVYRFAPAPFMSAMVPLTLSMYPACSQVGCPLHLKRQGQAGRTKGACLPIACASLGWASKSQEEGREASGGLNGVASLNQPNGTRRERRSSSQPTASLSRGGRPELEGAQAGGVQRMKLLLFDGENWMGRAYNSPIRWGQ
jgi:hypothetical protein